jgi:hypothetical protein
MGRLSELQAAGGIASAVSSLKPLIRLFVGHIKTSCMTSRRATEPQTQKSKTRGFDSKKRKRSIFVLVSPSGRRVNVLTMLYSQQHKADGGMTMWTASVGFGQLVRLGDFVVGRSPTACESADTATTDIGTVSLPVCP